MSQNISRRAVARGTAWTVPALAVSAAAPAMAASAGCKAGPVTVRLGAGTRTVLATGPSGMPSKIRWSSTDATTGVTVSVITTAGSGTILGRRTAYAVDSYVDTDLTSQNGGLNIQHVTNTATAPGPGGESETVQVSFTRGGTPVSVSNFSVAIDDIDAKGGNWTDGVSVTASGGTFTASVGTAIDGVGTAGTSANYTSGPWHNTSTNSGGDQNAPSDRVSLTAASLTGFSLVYNNLVNANGMKAAGSNSDQNIQLTNMTFQAPAC